MKKWSQVMYIGAAGLLSVGLAAQGADPQQTMREDKKPMQGDMHASGNMKAAQAIASWKPAPKAAAEMMRKKYGEPAEVTSMRIIWHGACLSGKRLIRESGLRRRLEDQPGRVL